MFRLAVLTVAVLCALVAASAATPASNAAVANPYVFETDMFGTNVVPPVDTVSWGFVRWFFNADRTEADYTVDVKGLSNTLVTGADVHKAPKGQNGPIVHHLTDGNFIVTSGHMRFTPSDWNDMAAGLWYVTLTSTLHPDGEIRGQVVLPPDFFPNLATPTPVAPPPLAQVPASPPPPPPPAPPPLPVAIKAPNTGSGGLLALDRRPWLDIAIGLLLASFGAGLVFVSSRSR